MATSDIAGNAGDTINIWQDGNTFYYQNITTDVSGTFTFNNNNNTEYFIIGTDYIKIDGQAYTVTINSSASNYGGLIKYNSANTGQNININNIKVDGTNSNLTAGGGWIGQSNFKYGNFINCSSNGPIGNTTNSGCGGIVGRNAARPSGIVTALSCYSTGSIDNQSGGIFGSNASSEFGQATAQNCYSTGSIDNFSGGIFGSGASLTYGKATAQNCYSTGSIDNNSGGIFGSGAGINNGYATAENCYSTGDINIESGGIFGLSAGINGQAAAQNCYSTGPITGDSGGIFGGSAGYNNGQATATKCMYNGTYNTTPPRYGQLAGLDSQNITPTNILGFINLL